MSLPELSTELEKLGTLQKKNELSTNVLLDVEIQIWTDFRTIALHHYLPLCAYTILVTYQASFEE